jgi:hypothetical protein
MCTPSKSGKMSRSMLVGETTSGDEDDEADSDVVKPDPKVEVSCRMGSEAGKFSRM